MKNILILILTTLAVGCKQTSQNKPIPIFVEKELSFLHLRFGYNHYNNWIKNPVNIQMIHETFKKVGYNNLISEDQWNDDWNWYFDVSKSPKHLIDSLELSYHQKSEFPEYYKQFWNRRIKDGNQEVVYQTLKEIKTIMIDSAKVKSNLNYVNDTLYNLLNFEYPRVEIENQTANKLLNYLIEIGLHESAYNLRSGQCIEYENVKWENELKQIRSKLDTTKRIGDVSPWFQDDIK